MAKDKKIQRVSHKHLVTSIGRYARPTNKQKRRRFKRYNRQGRK